MHLDLVVRPFVPYVGSWEPCDFTKVTDGPQVYALDVLRLHKKGVVSIINIKSNNEILCYLNIRNLSHK